MEIIEHKQQLAELEDRYRALRALREDLKKSGRRFNVVQVRIEETARDIVAHRRFVRGLEGAQSN